MNTLENLKEATVATIRDVIILGAPKIVVTIPTVLMIRDQILVVIIPDVAIVAVKEQLNRNISLLKATYMEPSINCSIKEVIR